MGRVGHKDDCQCGICKRMAGKALKGKVNQVAPAGRTLGSLNPGREFKYQGRVYIKYGTAKGMVAVESASDLGEILRLSEDTIVEI